MESTRLAEIRQRLAPAPAVVIVEPMEIGKDDVGRCDFLDVLEERAKAKGRARVVLDDGSAFVETVRDVVTEGGADYAVFDGHGRVAVKRIVEVTPKYGA